MNKKLITLAVAAAMAAPAAVLAEATIYGKLHNHIDYVDVDQNAVRYGPNTIPSMSGGVPANGAVLQPDNIFITTNSDGIPVGVQTIPGGLNTEWTAPADGVVVTGSGDRFFVVDGEVVANLPKAQNFNGWDINGNNPANRVGIKGSEDLGGGLKAIYQVELGVRLVDADGDINNGEPGRLQFRNSFVGLAGNFGTFLVGRHDTPLKISTGKLDLFSDTLADYNYTVGFMDVRADNTIAYISPSFSGFQFAGAVIPSGGGTPLGYGAPGEAPDGIADAWSVAGIYSNGPFYASAAYENLGSQHWASTLDGTWFNADTGLFETSYLGIPNYGTADDWSYYRFGLGLLDWNGFTLTGIYENHSNVLGAPKSADMDIWQFQAAYAFGNNTIKGMYGQNSPESCVGGPYNATCDAAVSAATGLPATDVAFLNQRDVNSWAVAFDHNFSKRTRVYALYTATESDQVSSDWSGFSLGMIHNF